MSELVVLYYVIRQLNDNRDFTYEPQYNSGFNPECSFAYGGKTVNIEVKCPHMGKRIEIESHNTLKIFPERMPNKMVYCNSINDLCHISFVKKEREKAEKQHILSVDKAKVDIVTLKRRVALCELVSHEILDEKARRRRSVFSDGTVVEGDFDACTFEIRYPDGETVTGRKPS